MNLFGKKTPTAAPATKTETPAAAPAAEPIPAGSPAVDLQAEGLPTEVAPPGDKAVAPVAPVTPLAAAVDPASPTPPPPAPPIDSIEQLKKDAEALLAATADAEPTPGQPLRTDGPTLEEYVAAGYQAENYPPQGYAVRTAPKPVKKFYHALNSNRYIRAGGLQFSFGAYQHVGGTWMGTFATDVASEIAILDEMVAKKQNAITALTAEEYDDCQKKKLVAFHLSGQSLIQLGDQSPSSQQSARLADPLNSEPAAPVPTAPPVQSAADALTVGKVEAPPAQ